MKLLRSDFNKIINNIYFRFLQPHEPCKPLAFDRTINAFDRLLRIDEINVSFRENDAEIRKNLSFLDRIPRMSTLANAYLIYEITKYLEPSECYLNIGVWRGFSFFAGILNSACTSIGVDNFSKFGGPEDEFLKDFEEIKNAKSLFFKMDYVDYLKEHHQPKIGFYFYDGDHSYSNQLQSLEMAEPFYASNAVILVDDTNMKPARRATLDFINARHGEYQVLFDQFTANNGHPTFWNGLMLVQKCR